MAAPGGALHNDPTLHEYVACWAEHATQAYPEFWLWTRGNREAIRLRSPCRVRLPSSTLACTMAICA